jgi:hypothetical protein
MDTKAEAVKYDADMVNAHKDAVRAIEAESRQPKVVQDARRQALMRWLDRHPAPSH